MPASIDHVGNVRQMLRAARTPPGSCRSISQSKQDIVLEVPGLAVDSLALDVVALRAHLSLDASAMRLVEIEAGLDLTTTKTRLGMGDVFTEAYFHTSLGNVTRIIDRVIQSLNRNPALLTGAAPSPTTPPPTGADSSAPPAGRSRL